MTNDEVISQTRQMLARHGIVEANGDEAKAIDLAMTVARGPETVEAYLGGSGESIVRAFHRNMAEQVKTHGKLIGAYSPESSTFKDNQPVLNLIDAFNRGMSDNTSLEKMIEQGHRQIRLENGTGKAIRGMAAYATSNKTKADDFLESLPRLRALLTETVRHIVGSSSAGKTFFAGAVGDAAGSTVLRLFKAAKTIT